MMRVQYTIVLTFLIIQFPQELSTKSKLQHLKSQVDLITYLENGFTICGIPVFNKIWDMFCSDTKIFTKETLEFDPNRKPDFLSRQLKQKLHSKAIENLKCVTTYIVY